MWKLLLIIINFIVSLFKLLLRHKVKTIIISGANSIFAALLLIPGVDITTTGDIFCGENCTSYFNLTSKEVNILVSQGMQLNFVPEVEYELFLLKDSEWNRIAEDEFFIERGELYQFKLVGYKEKYETVKWGVTHEEGVEVDPVWYGIEEETVSYTPSSETHCSDGTCTLTLYSGTMFTEEPNDNWYTLPEVSTVKWQSGGFNFSYRNYWVLLEPFVIYNGNEKTIQDIKNAFPNVKLKDYVTASRFNHKFALNFSNVPQNLIDNTDYLGLRLKDSYGLTWNDVQKSNYSIIIKNKVVISYYDLIESHFTLNLVNKSYLLIGNISNNSENGVIYLDPTIQLQDADSENLDDVYVTDYGSTAHDSSYGTCTTNRVLVEESDNYFTYIKFNLSSIPSGQTIDSSTLYLNLDTNMIDAGESMDVDVHHVYPAPTYNISGEEWIESDACPDLTPTDPEMDWDNRPNEASEYNTVREDYINFDNSSSIDIWYDWTVTDMVTTSYNDGDDKITIGVLASNEVALESSDWIAFASKEKSDTTIRPYLNITYSEAAADSTPPTYSSNSTNSTVAGASIKHSLKWTDVNNDEDPANLSGYIFSWYNGVNWSNINESTDREAGEQTFSGEAGAGENHTSKKCDDTWGVTNAGGTDYTMDDCAAAGHYTDEHVEWIQVNATTVVYGTTVNATVYVECYSNADDIGISYNNGTGWVNKFCQACGGTGHYYYSTTFTVDSVAGEHWIRGTQGYNKGCPHTCADGQDSDNDDVNFTVIASGGAGDENANKTAVNYSDVIPGNLYEVIDNITVTINVSYYNTSGSIENKNMNATLWLEIYNGSDWIDESNFSVSGIGNTSKYITTSSILTGWRTEANRDIKISARLMDYNDSSHFDTINWTAVWIKVGSQQEMLNDSFVDMTGTLNWSNVTKTVTSTTGATIKWCVYANDTSNNWNKTSCDTPFSYVTTTVDTCTYTTGTWNVNCFDNCSIITNTNLGGDDIIFNGTGTFTVNANITNIGKTSLSSGCKIVIGDGQRYG